MIITDEFVVINFPKTGSTFVRNTLKRVHQSQSILNKLLIASRLQRKPYFENLWLPNIRTNNSRRNKLDEHGVCSQIPSNHLSKQIVSVKRNLFEHYISSYEYGDWKKAPWVEEEILNNKFANYPNLSFEQYVNLIHEFNPMEYHPRIGRKLNIGPASCQFLLFYFKRPFDIIIDIDQDYLEFKKYKDDMYPVHFLDQANLNEELYNFLIKYKYPKNRVSFILEEGKHNTSTPTNKSMDDYFTDSLMQKVKDKEALLFSIFNDYYV
ncbi:MAG: hypothetical protein DWP94_10600 [Flavobacterium sp.]|nr:MAG: hypothetical protein DWP94_10600 [Flavobacterium sp.]